MSTLRVELVNNSTSTSLYCVISGYDMDQNNKLMLLSSDGKTPYYPPAPPAGTTNQPLPQDCSISMGAPGTTTVIALPHIGGCRVWFSTNQKLKFGLNPGPALVEPSCTNFSDPNINVNWNFAELTYNAYQIFANISCVDFVSNLPVSATLTTTSGSVDHVSGMGIDGLANVCRALKAQKAVDQQPWDALIFNGPNSQPLRVLSPNNTMVGNPSLFKGYFDTYVNAVFAKYTGSNQLSCDTQAQYGVVKGSVTNSALAFDNNKVSYSKPSTTDILSCCSGPFANGSPEQLTITPRLSAAFNRGTLLTQAAIPDPQGPATFYKDPTCNHYARIVHEQLLDGRGYAFPYDDVCQSGGPDQCGAVYDSNPQTLRFAVGGNMAHVTPGAPGAPAQ